MTTNTRKYPRTTIEAFGVDARTSCAIERPAKSEHFYSVMLALAIAFALAAAVVAWAMEPVVNNEPVSPCGENGVLIEGKCYLKNGKKVRT